MALSPIALTDGGNATPATSFATGSFTPAASALVLATVMSNHASTTPNIPSLTGSSLTWVQVATLPNASNFYRVTMFRAMGAAPSSGTLTFDFAGQTQSACQWLVTQFTGTDTSGTNGSGAVVQNGSADSFGASQLITLSAFANAQNAAYGAIFISSTTDSIVAGSGFSLIGASASGAWQHQDEWNLNDPTVDWSWSTNHVGLALAIEIAVSTVVNRIVQTNPMKPRPFIPGLERRR